MTPAPLPRTAAHPVGRVLLRGDRDTSHLKCLSDHITPAGETRPERLPCRPGASVLLKKLFAEIPVGRSNLTLLLMDTCAFLSVQTLSSCSGSCGIASGISNSKCREQTGVCRTCHSRPDATTCPARARGTSQPWGSPLGTRPHRPSFGGTRDLLAGRETVPVVMLAARPEPRTQTII